MSSSARYLELEPLSKQLKTQALVHHSAHSGKSMPAGEKSKAKKVTKKVIACYECGYSKCR